TITVQTQVDCRNLLIRVMDDGTGFELAKVRRGRGLANLHNRARSIGAGVEIESSTQLGTSVTLTPVYEAGVVGKATAWYPEAVRRCVLFGPLMGWSGHAPILCQPKQTGRGTEDKGARHVQKLDSEIAVTGIDIGKNSFHFIGQDRRGS